ncbi:MAG: ribosomal protein S18-alanine N-acetyltransferase [Desulfobacterales bacterium]|nr:MAG: ribosomal protein S18-alanine N-acetyltransferase [Desulfobacterales bacterium]
MNSWQLDTISDTDELEPILAIERHSFTWPWGRLSFEGELSCRNACNLVVKSSENGSNEQVIAYAFFRLAADELHILKIAVTAAWRRRGIATRLTEQCLKLGKERGATSAHLEVRPSNTPAVELYQKLGFKVVGCRHNYYTDSKEDALVMMKNLKEEL